MFFFGFVGSEGWFFFVKNVGFTNVDSSAYGINSRTVCGVLTPKIPRKLESTKYITHMP